MIRHRKNEKMKGVLPLIVIGIGVIFLISALVLILLPDNQTASSTDFSLPDLQGRTVSLSDYQGEVVLVNFWATWCPPCKAEMPVLQAYYEAYQDQGFVILAVNDQESQSKAQAFILETGYTFPVLVDPAGEVSWQYGVTSLPTTIVFDRQGTIVYRHTGMITPDVLDREVTALLTK